MMSGCERSKSKKKRGHGFLIWMLCFCIMLTEYPELSGEGFVLAKEEESLSGNDISDISEEALTLPKEEESLSGNDISDISEEALALPKEEESLSGNDISDISEEALALPKEESLSDNDISAEVYAEEAKMPEADQRSQPEAMWQTNAGWVEGSLSEAVENVANGGIIVLLSDVSLTNGLTISKSMRITSYDAGKPFTIKNITPDTVEPSDSGRIFTVTAGRVCLQDIILDGGRDEGVRTFHPLICLAGQNARLDMYQGTVLQNAENVSQTFCGGGINIRSGQVYLYDGARITDCKARHGGGIEVNGKDSHMQAMLGMAGGSIDGCEAEDGGGVYVNIGIFQMIGGEITGNQAVVEGTDTGGGGGIYLAGASREKAAAALITGGKITNNRAESYGEAKSYGGGILVWDGTAQLQIKGGTLEGNTAQFGGGIFLMWGRLQLHGGTVTGNTAGLFGGGILGTPLCVIELQGNPKVFGNTAGATQDRFDNLYLDGEVDASGRETTVPVQLTGPLTEGVELGLSLWVRPDEDGHPYRDMIVSSDHYTIQPEDFDRLYDGGTDNKELYADNMEKYALIPYNGKIVMVPAVHVSLDRDSLVLESEGETASLTATVTPAHAPVKDVTWTSSDETVATVDENGKVTATGKGEADITVTTVSPYRESDSCRVTVGIIPYQIVYHLEGGELKEGETNPDSYTIKSGEIILNAPVRSGYRFVGWEGTDLAEITPVVIIPSGSTGAREYTAVWEKEESPGDTGDHSDDDSGKGEEETDGQTDLPENGEQSAEKSGGAESQTTQSIRTAQNAEPRTTQGLKTAQDAEARTTQGLKTAQDAETRTAQSAQTTQNPRTGSHIFWLYATAALSAFCMLFLTVMQIKRKKGKSKQKRRRKGRK